MGAARKQTREWMEADVTDVLGAIGRANSISLTIEAAEDGDHMAQVGWAIGHFVCGLPHPVACVVETEARAIVQAFADRDALASEVIRLRGLVP